MQGAESAAKTVLSLTLCVETHTASTSSGMGGKRVVSSERVELNQRRHTAFGNSAALDSRIIREILTV